MLRKTHHANHMPCQHVRLAHSGVGEICFCPDCGVVHVALQYFTVRFELEAFKALQAMLTEAQGKITQQLGNASTAQGPFALAHGDVSFKSTVH